MVQDNHPTTSYSYKVCLLGTFRVNGITQHVGFCTWLLSLSIATVCVGLRVYCRIPCCRHRPRFLWPVTSQWALGCSHSDCDDNAVVHIHTHVCMWPWVLISPRKGVSGSCSNSVSPFKELRAVFQVASRLCSKHLTQCPT